jgi:nucleotidyltransferase/DNA polymerase involved in DNA repair
MKRFIFHVDMDAFYASIEQRENLRYRGRPVIVGADPKHGKGRGVVAACSYEARRFGIRSALPISQAYRLCPHGIYVRPNMTRYSQVSRRIHEIFHTVTPKVEPLSIDEAFLDVSEKVDGIKGALELAGQLKRRIMREQRLTASVGIAASKFVAKIASDLEKPDGLVIVEPENVQAFLDPLPISRIWGVGPKTEERLKEIGVNTIEQLRTLDAGLLKTRFGKMGDHLWNLANGIDSRSVVTERNATSLSQERTFSEDTNDQEQLAQVIQKLSSRIAERLAKHAQGGRTVTLKLRYSDFTTLTRQISFRHLVCSAQEIREVAVRLLYRHWDKHRKIRLLGIAISPLESLAHDKQMRLF